MCLHLTKHGLSAGLPTPLRRHLLVVCSTDIYSGPTLPSQQYVAATPLTRGKCSLQQVQQCCLQQQNVDVRSARKQDRQQRPPRSGSGACGAGTDNRAGGRQRRQPTSRQGPRRASSVDDVVRTEQHLGKMSPPAQQQREHALIAGPHLSGFLRLSR